MQVVNNGESIMLFYFNFLWSLIGATLSVLATIRRGFFLSLQSLAWASTMLFFFIEPLISQPDYLDDSAFNGILTFGLFGLTVATYITPLGAVEGPCRHAKYEISRWVIVLGTVVFASYAVIRVALILLSTHSMRDVFSRPLVQQHLGEGYFLGTSILELSMEPFKALFFISIATFTREGRYIKAIILFMIPVLLHLLTAATRFGLASLGLAMAVLLFRRWLGSGERRMNPVRQGVMLAFLVSMFVLVVVYQYVGNYVRLGAIADLSISKLNTMEIVRQQMMDLRYYHFLRELHQAVDDGVIQFEYGVEWLWHNLISLIPRRLWQDKPITATSVRLTEVLHGKLGTGLPVYTYTIYGEGYLEFGYVGAMFAPIVLLLAYSLILRLWSRIHGSDLYRLYFGIGIVTVLRAEFPFAVLLLQVMIITILRLLSKPPRGDLVD